MAKDIVEQRVAASISEPRIVLEIIFALVFSY